MGGCATLPTDFERIETHAYTDTGDTRCGKAGQTEKLAHPGQSGFLLLGNGLDAFVARALLAQVAERSIDTRYYIIHNDVVGSLFIDQLYKAADRGVRVRLLIDDIDQGMTLSGPALGASEEVMAAHRRKVALWLGGWIVAVGFLSAGRLALRDAGSFIAVMGLFFLWTLFI
jgi:phosphatidylserine/phosphatidylglycerophosphate/cardiolipin synthase-like enzyme